MVMSPRLGHLFNVGKVMSTSVPSCVRDFRKGLAEEVFGDSVQAEAFSTVQG